MPPFSTSSTSHHTPCYRVYGINRKDSIWYLISVNTPLSSPLPHQYEYDKQAFPKRQCTQALTTLTFTQSATSSFFIIWKQHILKRVFPQHCSHGWWLAQGKDRQTLRGLILYGWQAQFHQQVNAAKKSMKEPQSTGTRFICQGGTPPLPQNYRKDSRCLPSFEAQNIISVQCAAQICKVKLDQANVMSFAFCFTLVRLT